MLFVGGEAGGGGGGGGGGEGQVLWGAPVSTKDSRNNRLLNVLRKSHGKNRLPFSGMVLAAVVGIIGALLREIFSPWDGSSNIPVSRNNVAHSAGVVMLQAPRMELGSSSVQSAHRQWRTARKARRTVVVVVRVIRFGGCSFLAYSVAERVHV